MRLRPNECVRASSSCTQQGLNGQESVPSWTAVSHLPRRPCPPTVARVTTSASLDTTDVQLDPGDVIAIPVQVQNTGDIVEGYRIDVVGVPSAWAEVEPETFSLYPGTSATATC